VSARLPRALRALATLLVAVPLALIAAPFDSRADPPAIPSVGSAEEDDAYHLYRDEKYLTARTRAQAVLDRNPSSAVGHYVLGSVLRDAEGSLPRSMAHLREAQRLYNLRPASPDAGYTRLGRDILWSLSRTAQLLEQYDVQLALLDEYGQKYPPAPIALHVWPLMKLRRFDEARAFAREALLSGNPMQETTALNGLCAIEGEAHRQREAYEACKRTLDTARSHGETLAVYGHNAALGALGVLHFEEAESFAREGGRKLERTNSNPWLLLSLLYTGEGRTSDTVAALREMQRWRAAQPPRYRDQKSAEVDGVIAAILLAAGESATGLRFVGRAIDRPDRRAVTAASPDQSIGGHALLRRALLRLDAEVNLERASSQGVAARALALASAAAERAQAWPDEERAIAVLANDERLDVTLRPYSDGALDPCPPWLAGDLVGLLGPGVVAAALARTRAADASIPETAPYFDAIEAEVALARGDDARAFDLASATLDALPRAEALLRARVAAVGAEAAARRGQVSASLGLFERAMSLDPGVVRRLGLAIPARVEVAGGGAPAAHAGAMLERSPRLHAAASAFVVRVEGDARHLTACLLTPSAAQLACGEATAAAGDGPDSLAARLSDDFHRAAFAMRFSLTPTDLRSLDGSTTMAQGSAREALRGLFDETTAPH
jgi:hypothetical protein